MRSIAHPLVVEVSGGGACPERHEGRLRDGRAFHFRYRLGQAWLGLGATDEEALVDTACRDSIFVEHGGRFQGAFDSDAERDRVFAQLLELRLQRDVEDLIAEIRNAEEGRPPVDRAMRAIEEYWEDLRESRRRATRDDVARLVPPDSSPSPSPQDRVT